MDNRPIGVFDSGVGGLTAVRALLRDYPNESIVYFGDTARVPYGNRDKDVDGLMAKLGLDKLKPIHWILGGVGLVVLISLIGVVGRGNERRKLERRAERLRSGSTDVTASLRASMQGKKRGPRLK